MIYYTQKNINNSSSLLYFKFPCKYCQGAWDISKYDTSWSPTLTLSPLHYESKQPVLSSQ